MDPNWTLADLVVEATTRLEALPPPKNGQVRAVPDERTVRYYAALGLLDKPRAMRGRTALYGPRHLAQIVAIKRMQSAGHSLADIQQMWPTLDEGTLSRISGVAVPALGKRTGRTEFWKREPDTTAPSTTPATDRSKQATPLAPDYSIPPAAMSLRRGVPKNAVVTRVEQAELAADSEGTAGGAELRVEVAPGVAVSVAIPGEGPITISPATVRAIRAAAASLVTELANRGLIARGSEHDGGGEP